MMIDDEQKKEYFYDLGDYEPDYDKPMAPELEAFDKVVEDKIAKIKQQRDSARAASNLRKKLKDTKNNSQKK
jgi:hypothetical protein